MKLLLFAAACALALPACRGDRKPAQASTNPTTTNVPEPVPEPVPDPPPLQSVDPSLSTAIVPFGDIKLQLELGKWTVGDIEKLITEARAEGRDGPARLAYIVEKLKGTKFEYESQLPIPPKDHLRVRLESFGCTGFGLYTLALTGATDFEEFAHNLRVLRYWQTENRGVDSDPARGNIIDFAYNNFVETALARGFVDNVTAEVVGDHPLTTFKTRFTARRRTDEYDTTKRLIVPKVHLNEVVETKLISTKTFLEMDRSKIRSGDILLFSRVKPDVLDDTLLVGHVGVARNEGGEIYLAHATRDYMWRPEAKKDSAPSATGNYYLEDPRREQLGVTYATTWVEDPDGRKVKIDGKSYYGYHPTELRPLTDYLGGAHINGIMVLRPKDRPADQLGYDRTFRLGQKRIPLGATAKDEVVIDSAMTADEAIRTNLPADARATIVDRVALVDVTYPGDDGKLHQGQIVVHEDLVQDVYALFEVIRTQRYAMTSVIPISHPKYLKDGRWDDETSMSVNNTSAFNYRVVKGTKTMSSHACGRAIDLNPLINPYIKGATVQPAGATYDPAKPGTLTAEHPIVKKMEALGWTWGGKFTSLKDWQHFEKGRCTAK